VLSFDFEPYDGQPILTIRRSGRQVMNDNSVGYEEVCIGFTIGQIIINVNIDTDELEVSELGSEIDETAPSSFADIPELADCIGQELGWCWEARNYRGYWDAFCISVSAGPLPDVCFVGLASRIDIRRMSPITAVK